MLARLSLVMFALSLGLTSSALAQRSLDVERFRPAVDEAGFLGMQGTRPPASLDTTFGVALVYSSSPLTLRRPDGVELDVIAHRLTGDMIAQLGLGGRLAIAVDVPVVLYQDGAPGPLRDGGPSIGENAFGDPRFLLRYRFIGEATDEHLQGAGGLGVALLVGGTAPLGGEPSFAGERSATGDLQLLTDFQAFGAGIGLMLGVRHRFETVDVLGVRFRDEVVFGAGLKVPIPVTTDFLGMLEIRGATDGGDPFDQPRTAVEGDVALRLIRSDLAFTLGAGMGFADGVGTPGVRGLATVAWAPRAHDLDGDGIPDAEDECVGLPEDFDNFEDENGCEDPDNDEDFVFDADDACPNEAAEEGRDEDEDGCTDAIVDGDADGIVDAEDACPEAPEDADGHQDTDGCPELDNDGDGVPDANDTCADQNEDLDGFQDGDGCLDADNDDDGVADGADRCVAEPEDRDQHDDEDGCPDLDDDRDGVPDASDRCPTELETINGVTDDDGCPDRGGRARVRARGTGTEMVLEGSLRVAGPAVDPIADLEQLAHHLRAQAPAQFAIAMRTCVRDVEPETAACLAVVRAALVARGVPESRFVLTSDPALGRDRFRASIASPPAAPAPPADPAAAQAPPADPPAN